MLINDPQEARAAERRKQEEYIKKIEVSIRVV